MIMFKKSLAAVAVLGAFAGSAFAANVTMYGVIDTGLMYTYEDETDGDPSTEATHTLGLDGGINSSNRFGIKGTEELGNGMKVSFNLENGFKSDTGAFKTKNTLFDREASLSFSGDFGTISMGRMGGVASSAGTYDIVYSMADAFDGGDNNILGLAISGRSDNMITYQTPKFAGLQGTFQYSFNQKGAEDDQSSLNDQFFATAITGEFGNLNVVGAYEYTNRSKEARVNVRKDAQTIYLGGNYDFGFAKTFVMAQYFEGADAAFGFTKADILEDDTDSMRGMKGYGLHVGTIVPVMNGNLKAGLYYVDGKIEGFKAIDMHVSEDSDASYIGGSVRYEYPLSKRTSLYLGGGAAQAKIEEGNESGSDYKEFIGQAYTGLTHRF